MPDSLQYQQCRQLIEAARQLDQAHQYSEAAQRYRQAFDLCRDNFAASRYIHCARKSGVPGAREAVTFGRQVQDLLQENEHVRREYVWAAYDGYLKNTERTEDEEDENLDEPEQEKVEASVDFTVMVKAARRILELTAEPLPRKLSVFAICKEAKLLRRWELMCWFAQQLDPQTPSLEQKELNGRRLPSDYQKWTFAIIRALLELERYEECIVYAREASEKFPEDSFHFQRWEALAKIRMGQVEDGLRQLEYINMRFPKQWYIQSDIANAHVQLGQYEDALLWFCRAASMPGDIKGRIITLKSMCDVLQRLAYWQAVYEHLRLVWAIELEQGSKRNAVRTEQQLHEFQRLHANQLQIASENGVSTIPSALKPCRTTWQKRIRLAHPTQSGRISFLNEEKRFGFVTNDDGRFHFKFNAFRGRPELNAWVEFEMEDSFDQKRGEASKIAVNIRPVKGPLPNA